MGTSMHHVLVLYSGRHLRRAAQLDLASRLGRGVLPRQRPVHRAPRRLRRLPPSELPELASDQVSDVITDRVQRDATSY